LGVFFSLITDYCLPVTKKTPISFFLKIMGSNLAVRDVNLDIPEKKVIAFIGPSGCGKSTVLRCFNRMNDLVKSAKIEGKVTFRGQDIYGNSVNPIGLRSRIGMVFQKPNPFPKSIYENIAFGARLNGYIGDMDQLVEESLKKAVLWDEFTN